ncbi:MAG TPA: DeoR/GlpR family DNA-binding transcription regulator [Candidatus Cybelea sp.]|nr:DeoR/GlpR family DNA-binding transcription regulator [Candidatus Cybelea sp.]
MLDTDEIGALSNLRLNERQGQLLEQLRRHRSATIAALAKALGVSTETVRRDVRWLAAKGLVVKSHGSVAWPDRREDRPLQRRLLANMPAKQAIAAAVAKEIADGESLLIDTGSTNIYVAEALQGHRNLTAITNSAPIAQRLSQSPGGKVLLAGGEVRADDSAAFGPSTLAFLERFQADTAVISAAAIGAEAGVMDNHLCEAEVCQALIQRAHRVILAADHTKFSAQGLVVACTLADINLLITDAPPPPELARALEAADVEVQIAG